jgi:hypothetical protein
LRRLRRHRALRYGGIAAAGAAALLAVAIVSSLAIDLGPAIRARAEREGSRLLSRPVHIGSLRILVARGVVEATDISIEGVRPTDRPFLVAERLLVSLDWSRLLQRRPEIVVTSVQLADWTMLVEKWPGRDNFPKLAKRQPASDGPSPVTVTLRSVHASRGHFTYEDHEAPWSVVAPNIELNVTKAAKYHGDVSFKGGTIAIQRFVPMWAGMNARFVVDGGLVHLTEIEIDSDGAKTAASGTVDVGRFPEMTYTVESRLDSPRMRELFFANDSWPLSGEADFAGTFHLFKGGHELSGTFACDTFGLYDYRFPSMHGSIRWTDDLFEITDASAGFFGGASRFAFSVAPLGMPERPTGRFEFSYEDVDLAALGDFHRFEGQRFAGRAQGRNTLEWRMGRFRDDRHGDGRIIVSAPPGVEIMPASLEAARAADPGHSRHEWGPFVPQPLETYLPVAGELTYRYDPDAIELEGGRFATERTQVAFAGSTAWGADGRMPFRVVSRDWQEADQLLAGILTDFGSPTGVVNIGGRGEFDGVLTGPFRRPRVEGRVVGEDVRAWDTLWGDGSAHIVVENGYVTVTDGVVRREGSEIRSDGRFSLQRPRRDGGEEIDARFRATRGDIASLRHAFEIDDYDVSGDMTGEFHLRGEYGRPIGFGAMRVDDGLAYGERFEHGSASLRFDGNGVWLDGANLAKGTGSVSGAAYVGWDATYSFNADGRRIPVGSMTLFAYPEAQPAGVLEFSAAGSGTFDEPRYDVKFRVDDLSVAGEAVGQVTGALAVRDQELNGTLDAASPTLALTGTGRIALTPRADAELAFRFHDLSLDPYVRVFMPKLSTLNTALASGSVRVSGELATMDRLAVDGQVDNLEMRLFDYSIRSAAPIRLVLDKQVVRVDGLELVGDDTRLHVGGAVGLHDRSIALRAEGDANLGILQAFFRDVRGSGRAELLAAIDGRIDDPIFSGTATITDGRVRHFALPNSLDDINGAIRFDSRGVRLDDVTATMGQGRVQFGGRVGLEGYLPGELNVIVRAEGMHLRIPQGMRSTVDADLTLRGNFMAPTLGGTVTVRDATFNRRIDPTSGLFEFGGGASPAGLPVAQAPVPSSFPLRLDVELLVPSTLRVDNNLARLVASANLQLRGTYDRPQLSGRAEIDRGEVTLEGRRYLVTKGTVDFTNPARIEPFFDLEAETRVRVPGETYRVTIRLTGTTAQLQPSLDSDPPLPSAADVLALLFSDVRRSQPGRPEGGVEDIELRTLQNPNERQTDILTTRATQLLANPISSEVGRVVEQTFGVDTFQLSPSLIDPYSQTATTRVNPSARVTIGKRISDRVYLTFSRSLSSSFNDQILLLEYDESDRFSWILSRNEDQTYALEVSVRHSF